jgi:hypothetical protein
MVAGVSAGKIVYSILIVARALARCVSAFRKNLSAIKMKGEGTTKGRIRLNSTLFTSSSGKSPNTRATDTKRETDAIKESAPSVR